MWLAAVNEFDTPVLSVEEISYVAANAKYYLYIIILGLLLYTSFMILYCSASQPFGCHGPLFAETLFWGPLHRKFVSEQSFIPERKLLQNERVLSLYYIFSFGNS